MRAVLILEPAGDRPSGRSEVTS